MTISLSGCTVPGERGEAVNVYISCYNYGIKTQTIETNIHIHRQQW